MYIFFDMNIIIEVYRRSPP